MHNDNTLNCWKCSDATLADLFPFQHFLQPLFCTGHNLSSPPSGFVVPSAPQSWKQSQWQDSQWDNSFATVHGPPNPPFPFHVHLCTGFYIRKMRHLITEVFLKNFIVPCSCPSLQLIAPPPWHTQVKALVTRLEACCQRCFFHFDSRHYSSKRPPQWKKPKSPPVTWNPQSNVDLKICPVLLELFLFTSRTEETTLQAPCPSSPELCSPSLDIQALPID